MLEPGKAWVAWLILLLLVIAVPIVLANMLAGMWRVQEWTGPTVGCAFSH